MKKYNPNEIIRLNVDIPAQLHFELKWRAKQAGLPLKEVVRRLCEHWVRGQRQKAL